MAKIAYKRVSTSSQNTDRQLQGMSFDKVFTEKISGKNLERPALQEMLNYIREGDVVHVHELSRLARNLIDLKTIVEKVIKSNATIIFHKENFEFSRDKAVSPMQKMLFNHLAAYAEFERDLLLERQREGIEAAKQKGVYKGRKSKFSRDDIEQLAQDFNNPKRSQSKKDIAAKKYGITESYAYRLIKRLDK